MNHTGLVNHIKGSYLKTQYLEAFLTQSAYIEGLLKLLADYTFWDKVVRKILTANPNERGYLSEVSKKIENQSLYDLIEFLNKVKLITSEQKTSLHHYRAKRNKILHDLVKEIRKEEFEKDLKEICDLGNRIIEDEDFKKMARLLEGFEASQETIKSQN